MVNSINKNKNNLDFIDQSDTNLLDIDYYLIDNKLKIVYNSSIFKETTINWWTNKIFNIMDTIQHNPDNKISKILNISKIEETKLLKWGTGQFLESINEPIYELIDKNISNNIAINYQNINITYLDLKDKTDNISNFIKNKELYQESIIMCLDHNQYFPLYMLGIMKSGNIYVPVLPETPIERFKYIIDDTNCKLVITNKKYSNKIKSLNLTTNIDIIYIEEISFDSTNTIDIIKSKNAYIIYTSGTTGVPKGVLINHIGLTNSIIHLTKYDLELDKNSIMLQLGVISFDMSIIQILAPLSVGSLVKLVNLKDSNIESQFNSCTHILTTPDILNLFKPSDKMTTIMVGGSSCPISLVNKFKHKNVKFINGYGPTECTQYCISSTLDINEDKDIPIGKPINNVNCYIVKNRQLCPIDIIGEIWIGGIGIADGYLKNDELNNSKFIKFNNDRIYKTGDLGRWTENGELQFIGREENQVKINGIRIELGEIEQNILKIDQINECVVLYENNQLIAYYTPKLDIDINIKLQDFLSSNMIPQFYYSLENMPLNNSGKIDTTKLPKHELQCIDLVPPKTDKEKQMVKIWEELLGITKIGINDNFLELGGDSLLAIKLSHKIDIPSVEIINNPTIKQLSSLKTKTSIIDSINKKIPYTVSLSPQQQEMLLYQQYYKNNTYTSVNILKINKKYDIIELNNLLNDIVNHNHIYRTIYNFQNNIQIVKPFTNKELIINNNFDIAKSKYTFDLSKEFSFKWEFYHNDLESYILVINTHHIATDNNSNNMLLNMIYNKQILIPELQYSDYAFWKSNQKLDLNRMINYLESPPSYSTFPLDYSRIENNTTNTMIYDLQFVKNSDYTQFELFIISCTLVLGYSQDDSVIMYPLLSKQNSQLKNTLGCFIGTNYYRFTPFIENETNKEYIMRSVGIIRRNNQDIVPLSKIIDKINYQRGNNTTGVAQIMVNSLDTKNNKSNYIEIIDGIDTIYLDIDYYLIDNKLKIVYNSSIFKETTIKWWTNKIFNIMDTIQHNPDDKISNILNISKIEENKLLKWGTGQYLEPVKETVYELIDRNTSSNIAINYKHINITYLDLKDKTGNISNFIKNKELYQESIIMSIDRDINIPLYMLGIMKSGNIYIPILPETPIERFKYIIENTKCKLVITNKIYQNMINKNKLGVEILYLEDLSNIKYPNIVIKNPKYSHIIYTSGTTGNPKGILFSHYNLMNSINSYKSVYPKYNSLYSTQIVWDPNFRELLLPLLNNKTVFVCNNILLDSIPSNVEWINGTPSVLYNISKLPEKLKLITSTGSKINKKYWNKVRHIDEVWSFYGPTECYDVSTIIKLINFNTNIGSPLPNYKIYIVKNSKLCPIGIIGEIWISGIGVAQKYINNIELTKEKFVNFNNDRTYKTGDLGKWTDNGDLEFIGREDNQVKINGIRVELSEIEQNILKIDKINECVVLYDNNKLIAYYTPKIDIDIKSILLDKLPKNMIPICYSLEKLPLNSSGKIDISKIQTSIIKLNDNIQIKDITKEIKKYIDCDFALIKKIYDMITDKEQLCLYINTNKTSKIDIFNAISLVLKPFWIIKTNDIDNLRSPQSTDYHIDIFINNHLKNKEKNIDKFVYIYNILCESLKITHIDKNISLEDYGIDSISFIQLDLLMNKKYNISLDINDNYNIIISKINQKIELKLCSLVKNPNKTKIKKLLVIFMALPWKTIFKNPKWQSIWFNFDCDILIVKKFMNMDGSYHSKKLKKELKNHCNRYKKIYFIANCNSWRQCIHYSNLATKCLISGAGINDICDKTIRLLKSNNDKIYFYYGNDNDQNFIYNLEETLKEKIDNFPNLNIYKNFLYDVPTHGIFIARLINMENFYTYFNPFMDMK